MKEPTITSSRCQPRPFGSRNLLSLSGIVACVALLILQAGCIFSPDRGKTQPPPPVSNYLPPTKPVFVLNNLIKAYADRDTTHYKDCYDLSYAGSSYDGYDQGGPVPATYTRDDEAAHIRALQRSTTIFHVSLDLPNYLGTPLDTLPGDPAGWLSMNIYNPKVQIDDQSGSIAIVAGEVFQYKFLRKTPDATSPTDTSWTIVRWAEIAPSTP